MCKVISLEDYRRKQQGTIIVEKYSDFPAPEKVTGILPGRLDGKPALLIGVIIGEYEQVYCLPLTSGFHIHYSNEFLRSLNLGLDIHFETYNQYWHLIDACGIELEEHLEEKERLEAQS